MTLNPTKRTNIAFTTEDKDRFTIIIRALTANELAFISMLQQKKKQVVKKKAREMTNEKYFFKKQPLQCGALHTSSQLLHNNISGLTAGGAMLRALCKVWETKLLNILRLLVRF